MKKATKYIMYFLLQIIVISCKHEQSYQIEPNLTYTVNDKTFEMVKVRGGTFMMGGTTEQGDDCDSNELPPHKENINSFYIGKYEVTQELWGAVMGESTNPSFNVGCKECPVERVSWKDVQIFITKLNILTKARFRLPTETEWEYAARGGIRSKKYKYSGSDNIDEVAWYIDNYHLEKHGEKATTHPVGMKKSNELGLYDMSGNVWEWCNDLYTKEYYNNGKQIHPGWPFKGTYSYYRRILRGGSWGGTAKGCRVSYIDYDFPRYKDEYGGFRLALDTLALDSIK